ncbi:MAG: hypothetical protein H6703_13785 [Myxococcales bacterium]|nr:hypothetical protein [Myxococcales bacterium]
MGVDVRGRWFGAGAELRGVWPSSAAFGGGEVRAGLLGMGLRGCGYGGRFGGCAVALGGWQRSSGAGFARNAALDAPYLAVGGRVMVAFAVGDGWWLRPVVEVVAPLTATRLTVGGATAWETPAVNGALGLEVGWR